MRFGCGSKVNAKQTYAYTGGRPFDPALPAVVFIHGAEHDHCVWALQSRYLAHHGRGVLAVDLPGPWPIARGRRWRASKRWPTGSSRCWTLPA